MLEESGINPDLDALDEHLINDIEKLKSKYRTLANRRLQKEEIKGVTYRGITYKDVDSLRNDYGCNAMSTATFDKMCREIEYQDMVLHSKPNRYQFIINSLDDFKDHYIEKREADSKAELEKERKYL